MSLLRSRAPGWRGLVLVLTVLSACGADQGVDTVPERPTYLENIAPILERSCVTCHGAATSMTETRNCVRADQWDSVPDSMGLCPPRWR